ncbi:MAG: response regulator [Rhodospirillaceae bacterium]|nr:response regulator [Rhodospirillaceae bacterium]
MEAAPHLLVVDDDREIRELLSRFLAKHGYRVSTARDAREARGIVADTRIDLVILDIMLPGEDGLALCRELRVERDPGIIMLTAMGEDTDRIVGLEMGADDYLAKPFNPRELVARIKAVLRRSAAGLARPRDGESVVLEFHGWRLDVAQRRLDGPDGVPVPLSAGEFDLLVAFAEHPQRVLSRDQLLDLTRGRSAGPFDRSVDVQVSRLRRKIETDPKRPALINTVRGGGYVFTAPVQRRPAPP